MKMHKRAMKRHSQHVEDVKVSVHFETCLPETPHRIVFNFDKTTTSSLVMSREETERLILMLAVSLKFEDQKASTLSKEDFRSLDEDWKEFVSTLRQ